MTLIQTTSKDIAYDKLRKEIFNAPVPNDLLPGAGAIEKSLEAGDVFLHDPADTGRARGTIVWINADPSWQKPDMLWVHHVWGESQKHTAILKDICQWLIDNGYGDHKVGYRRTQHPLTTIADQFAGVTFNREGTVASTTARKALAALTKAGF